MSKQPSMRTPLSRARYLGSAHSGTDHFWKQRVSSVALVNTTPGEILDNVQFLRGPEFLVSTRRRLAQTAVPLARLPLPKRLPLRRQLVSRVAVGTSADRSVGVEVDRIIGATPARGRGGYGAMLAGLLSTVDPAAQLTAGDPAALQVVEPRALALLPVEVVQARHDVLREATRASAWSTTLPGLMPSLSSTTLPGADAPNRSMPTLASA